MKKLLIHHLLLIACLTFSHTAQAQCTNLTQPNCYFDSSSTHKVECILDSGDSYRGWINCNNRWHGYGTYHSSSGAVYKGNYSNGKRHGYGTSTETAGVFSGKWFYGTLTGEVKQVIDDGTFVGNYNSQGKRDGVFIKTFTNGKIVETTYKNGEYLADQARIIKSLEQVEQEKREAEEARKKRELEWKQQEEAYNKCLVEYGNNKKEKELNNVKTICRSISQNRENKIYINCLKSKGLGQAEDVIKASKKVCEDISKNPSTFEKIRYGTF